VVGGQRQTQNNPPCRDPAAIHIAVHNYSTQLLDNLKIYPYESGQGPSDPLQMEAVSRFPSHNPPEPAQDKPRRPLVWSQFRNQAKDIKEDKFTYEGVSRHASEGTMQHRVPESEPKNGCFAATQTEQTQNDPPHSHRTKRDKSISLFRLEDRQISSKTNA
jgi:hypothetical protein